MPSLPFHNGKKKSSSPPFYALEDELPLFLAITSGLQHSLAMLAGLITPPIIFASALNLDAALSSYMISASLIGCGKYTNYHGHTSRNIDKQWFRHSQFGPNVPYSLVQTVQTWHRTHLGSWYKFCYAKHGERGSYR